MLRKIIVVLKMISKSRAINFRVMSADTSKIPYHSGSNDKYSNVITNWIKFKYNTAVVSLLKMDKSGSLWALWLR